MLSSDGVDGGLVESGEGREQLDCSRAVSVQNSLHPCKELSGAIPVVGAAMNSDDQCDGRADCHQGNRDEHRVSSENLAVGNVEAIETDGGMRDTKAEGHPLRCRALVPRRLLAIVDKECLGPISARSSERQCRR